MIGDKPRLGFWRHQMHLELRERLFHTHVADDRGCAVATIATNVAGSKLYSPGTAEIRTLYKPTVQQWMTPEPVLEGDTEKEEDTDDGCERLCVCPSHRDSLHFENSEPHKNCDSDKYSDMDTI